MVGNFRPLKRVNCSSSKTEDLLSRENSAVLTFSLNGFFFKKKSNNKNLVQTTYTAQYSLFVTTAPGLRLAEKVSPVNN